MILIIDNYDSFVHNLARYMRLAGAKTHIVRNDDASIVPSLVSAASGVIISPGPGKPKESGMGCAVLQLAQTIPVLGVCLGHQAIAEVYGWKTVRAREPMHGQASMITHDGTGVFENLPSPLQVGRYHSLVSTPSGDASPLIVQSRTGAGDVMAFRHCHLPHIGLQFHPESILTPHGLRIIKNFLEMCTE